MGKGIVWGSKLDKTEPDADKLSVHLNDSSDLLAQNETPRPSTITIFYNSPSKKLEAAVRLRTGITGNTDRSEYLGLLLKEQQRPRYGTTARRKDGESEEQFCPRPQREVEALCRTECCDFTTTVVKDIPRATHALLTRAAGNDGLMPSPPLRLEGHFGCTSS